MTPPREIARSTRHTRGFTHLAIRRPLGTLAITAVVLVLGLFATGRLPVNLLPNVVYPLVRVSVNYPGVAPEVIEEQLVRVLERQLSQTENLVLLSAEAEEGRADINLVFDYGVDLDNALQDAARLLEVARAQLPDDVEPPRIRKWDPGESAVFESGFSSSIRGPRDVRDWVETRLAPQLQSIPGVSGVEAIGGQEREIEVVLDQQRMNAYGLSLQTVAAAIGEENRNIAAGNITSTTFDVRARVDGRFTAPADLAQVLIPVAGSDRSVRLDDIATVRDGFREQRVFVRLNGVSATQMSVFKQPDANTVQVVEAVNAQLESLRESGFIPADIRWQTTKNESFFVRGSIDAVTAAALSGSLLSMIVVLTFLGSLRKSLAIGLSIPVAILATFSLMGLGGLTLNVISLGGLALGVGLLLDNAIVMLENIARHREALHKNPFDAAHDGADEVASAIVAGTLTNLAAVVPFLLASGFAAMVFRDLIITISFAVAVSLVVALTLVPMASAQLGRVTFRSRLISVAAERTRPVARVRSRAESRGGRLRARAASHPALALDDPAGLRARAGRRLCAVRPAWHRVPAGPGQRRGGGAGQPAARDDARADQRRRRSNRGGAAGHAPRGEPVHHHRRRALRRRGHRAQRPRQCQRSPQRCRAAPRLARRSLGGGSPQTGRRAGPAGRPDPR